MSSWLGHWREGLQGFVTNLSAFQTTRRERSGLHALTRGEHLATIHVRHTVRSHPA